MTITEKKFAPKQYLVLRKSIPMSQVTNKQMYDEAGKKLGAYMQEHGVSAVGPWSVLYFTWDMANMKTDMGIAFPVTGLTSIEDSEFSLVEIPESQVATAVLEGSYEGLKEVHEALLTYTKEKRYTKGSGQVMAIEEYRISPMDDANSAHWRTDVSYFYE